MTTADLLLLASVLTAMRGGPAPRLSLAEWQRAEEMIEEIERLACQTEQRECVEMS